MSSSRRNRLGPLLVLLLLSWAVIQSAHAHGHGARGESGDGPRDGHSDAPCEEHSEDGIEAADGCALCATGHVEEPASNDLPEVLRMVCGRLEPCALQVPRPVEPAQLLARGPPLSIVFG